MKRFKLYVNPQHADRARKLGFPGEIVVTDQVIDWMLITGKLSLKGEEELARRVKDGEPEQRVYAELLAREKKAIIVRAK